jgi:hypothetical protein
MSERVTARPLGTNPQLRLIEGGWEAREPLQSTQKEGEEIDISR